MGHASAGKAVLIGVHDGLGAVAQREFSQHMTYMCLNGLFRQAQFTGDLRVRQPAGDQPQHVDLPWGKGCGGRGTEPLVPPAAGEVADQTPGDRGGEEGVTGRTYLFCYMPLGAVLIARVLEELLPPIKGDAVDPASISTKQMRQNSLPRLTQA